MACMDAGKKFALGASLILVLVAGGQYAYISYERQKEATAPAVKEEHAYHLSDDQSVYLKKKLQSSVKDAKELNGTHVWMSAGGQLMAYAATPSQVNFKQPEGYLLGAEPIEIVNFITQKGVAASEQRIPGGAMQCMMLFRRPADPKKLLGMPVGYLDQGVWTFYLDEILFYDDPHKLFEHWGAKTWAAVDAHHEELGMNELQTQMTLGQASKPHGDSAGNRSVSYFPNGHEVVVTFQDDKAVQIQGQDQK